MAKKAAKTDKQLRVHRKPRKPRKPRKMEVAFTRERQEYVLRELANGRSLQSITDELGIDRGNVWQYRMKDPEFSALYRQAREEGAHALYDEIMREKDLVTEYNYNSKRLKIDTMKWAAGKLNKMYGDDKAVTIHTGGGQNAQVFLTSASEWMELQGGDTDIQDAEVVE